MRIIGGKLKGIRINPPSNLPVRPTTDMAKEALFNILGNQLEFDQLKVLDLFSGTGNVSLEFASRGAKEVISVDKNMGCYQFLRRMANQYQLETIQPQKADVFKFLLQDNGSFDLIFADPPFDIPNIPDIPKLVFQTELLKPGGMLIVEHPSTRKLDDHPNFREQRKYGYSSFSFFGR